MKTLEFREHFLRERKQLLIGQGSMDVSSATADLRNDIIGDKWLNRCTLEMNKISFPCIPMAPVGWKVYIFPLRVTLNQQLKCDVDVGFIYVFETTASTRE